MATIRQTLSTYAITILTHQRHSHFQRTANADLFLATLFRYRDAGRFQVHGFAIMPGHVHVMITPAIDQSTSRCVQLLKGGYSHAVREQSSGEIWHSGNMSTASAMRKTSRRRSCISRTIQRGSIWETIRVCIRIRCTRR